MKRNTRIIVLKLKIKMSRCCIIPGHKRENVRLLISFEKAFINEFLRIILSPHYWEFSPMKLGKTTFSHWEWGRYSAPKTWFLFVLINQAKYYAQDTGNQYSILGRLICLPDCDKTSENESGNL
jgi:hypothetical protein